LLRPLPIVSLSGVSVFRGKIFQPYLVRPLVPHPPAGPLRSAPRREVLYVHPPRLVMLISCLIRGGFTLRKTDTSMHMVLRPLGRRARPGQPAKTVNRNSSIYIRCHVKSSRTASLQHVLNNTTYSTTFTWTAPLGKKSLGANWAAVRQTKASNQQSWVIITSAAVPSACR
jgi:hypothetical protein